MLKEMTLYGEVDKVKVAINRLKLHEPKEGYYVAFSGGKDSCVVLELCKRAGVKYDAHYSVTTVDPPELIYFIRENYPDAWKNRMRPEISMWELIPKKRMPPTQRVRYCCKYFKERGGGAVRRDRRPTSRERETGEKKISGNVYRTQREKIHSSNY